MAFQIGSLILLVKTAMRERLLQNYIQVGGFYLQVGGFYLHVGDFTYRWGDFTYRWGDFTYRWGILHTGGGLKLFLLYVDDDNIKKSFVFKRVYASPRVNPLIKL